MKKVRNYLSYLFISILCFLAIGSFVFTGVAKKIYAETTIQNGGFAVVQTKSVLNIGNETKISNFKAINGGAFYVVGTLNMMGGTLSNNSATNGGAVYVSRGAFNMSDGTISGNEATNGSAIYVIGGRFTMNGGSISGDIYSASDVGMWLNSGKIEGKIDWHSSTPLYVKSEMDLSSATINIDNSSAYVYVQNYIEDNVKLSIEVPKSRTSGTLVSYYGSGERPTMPSISGYDSSVCRPAIMKTADGWVCSLIDSSKSEVLPTTWKSAIVNGVNSDYSEIIEDEADIYGGEFGIEDIKNIFFTTSGSGYKFSGSITTNIKFGITESNDLYIIYDGIILAPEDSSNLFSGFSNVKSIDFANFSGENVTSLESAFSDCGSLTKLDIASVFETSNVTNFSGLFQNCKSLSVIDATFDTISAVNMSFMFAGCSSLGTINFNGAFDTSKTISMRGMFMGCSLLRDPSSSTFDTSNVEDFSSMYEDSGIEYFYGFHTSSALTMSRMFFNCENLEDVSGISKFDTSKVTDMSYMFGSLTSFTKLTTIDVSSFKTAKVTNMSGMFSYATSLTEIIGLEDFDTSNVQSMAYMFRRVDKVKTLDLGTFKMTKCKSYNMFEFGSTSLIETIVCPNYCSGEIDLNAPGKFYREDTGEIVTAIPANVNATLRILKYTGEVDIDTEWRSYVSSDATKLTFDFFAPSDYILNGTLSNGVRVYENPVDATDFVVAYAGIMYANEDCAGMFAGYQNLKSIIFNNFDTSKVTSMHGMFDNCSALLSLDLSGFDTSKVTNMRDMFVDCVALTSVNVSGFNTANVKDFSGMFSGCVKLENLDLSTFKISSTASVSNMLNLGSDAELITLKAPESGADYLTVTCGTNLYYKTLYGRYAKLSSSEKLSNGMSYICGIELSSSWRDDLSWSASSSIRKLRFTNEYMSGDKYTLSDKKVCASGINYIREFLNEDEKEVVLAFPGIIFAPSDSSNLLTEVYCEEFIFDNFNTQNVTNATAMFRYCTEVQTLDLSMLDFSALRTAVDMFSDCKQLVTLKMFKNASPEDMSGMFKGCYNLKNLTWSAFNTSNATQMVQMFYQCTSLERVDLSRLNTYRVISMVSMFENCSSLTSIDMSSLDMSNVQELSYIFGGCSSLKNVYLPYDLDNVVDMTGMFAGCTSLEDLALEISVKSLQSTSNMFVNCSSLRTLDLSKFDMSNVSDCSNMLNLKGSVDWIKTPINSKNEIAISVTCDLFDSETLEQVSSVPADETVSHTYIQSLMLPTTWKSELTALNYIPRNRAQAISFETDESVLSSYTLIGTLSTGIKAYYSAGELVFYAPIKIKLPANSYSLFSYLTTLEKITLTNVSSNGVTDMSFMFKGCSNLVTVLIESNFNTDSVKTMSYMFADCTSLQDASFIKYGFTSFKSVTNLSSMFEGCTSLKTINGNSEDNGFDFAETSNLVNMSSMFESCSNLSGGFGVNVDTSKVKNFSRMFFGCSNIGRISFNSSCSFASAVNMTAMFRNCKMVSTIDFSGMESYTLDNVTSMSSMFANCIKLSKIYCIEKFVAPNVQEINYMFLGCQDLEVLDIGYLELGNCTEATEVFSGSGIKKLYAPAIVGCELSIFTVSGADLYNISTDTLVSSLNAGDNGFILARRFTITVNANGGLISYKTGWTLSQPNSTKNVYYEGTIQSFPSVSRTGYTLVGFFTSSAETGGTQIIESSDILSDYVLYARWKKTEYTLTFDSNGGEVAQTLKTIYYNTALGTLPIPTRTGYNFLGWSRNFFDYANIIGKYGVCIENNGQFSFKPTSTQTTYSLVISTYQDGTLVSTLKEIKATGYLYVTISKSSSFNRIQIRYKGDVEDAGFYYDVSALTNGNIYVLSLNVQTMALNNIVFNNVMIERNTSNVRSTYTNDYVTASTVNTFTRGYTLFARWESQYRALPSTWKDEVASSTYMTTTLNPASLTKISFEETIPEGYTLIGTLSTGLKVYQGTTSTEIAFVNSKIIAPANSSYLFNFGDSTPALKTIIFNNFYTTDVTDMSYMFKDCSNLETISFGSNFDTSAVTNITQMFYNCTSLTELDLSGFDLSNITAYDDAFNLGDNKKIEKINAKVKGTPPVKLTITCDMTVGYWADKDMGTEMSSLVIYTTSYNPIYVRMHETTFASNWKTKITGYANIKAITFTSTIPGSTYTLQDIYLGKGIKAYVNSTALALTVVFNGTIYAPIDSTSLFEGCSSLESITFYNFNTQNTTNMKRMFMNCKVLESIRFGSNFDTSKVTSMMQMFQNNYALTELYLYDFDTSSVTNQSWMFYGCSALETITLSNKFTSQNVTDTSWMFSGCSALKELDLSNMDLSNLSTSSTDTYQSMFNFLSSSALYHFKTPKNAPIRLSVTYNTTQTTASTWYKISSYSYATSTVYVPANSSSIEFRKGFVLTATAGDGTIENTLGWTVSGNTATKIATDGDRFGTLPTASLTDYLFNGWSLPSSVMILESTIISLDGATSLTISANYRPPVATFPEDWKTLIKNTDYMSTPIEPTFIQSIRILKESEFSAHGVTGFSLYGHVGAISVYAKKTGDYYDVVFSYGNQGIIYAPSESTYLFGYLNITSIIITNFYMGRMVYMSSPFGNDRQLNYVDLSGMDLYTLSSDSGMFDFGEAPINTFISPKRGPKSITLSVTMKYKVYASTDSSAQALTTFPKGVTKSVTFKRVFVVTVHNQPESDLGYTGGAGTFTATTGWTISADGKTATSRVFYGDILSFPTFTAESGVQYYWTYEGSKINTIIYVYQDMDIYPVYLL